MAAQGSPAKYIEGLRLSERERTILIEQMKKSGVADRRKSPRIIIEGNFSVLLTMEYPGGSEAHFRIYPWDLSRGGLGFFHRAFVYPGTRCSFAGLNFEGQTFLIKGDVVRCAHVSGNVHAVGVKLEAEIDPEVYLGAHGASDTAPSTAGGERVEDWWTTIGAQVAAISKLARDKAPPETLRKVGARLTQHLNTDPAPIAKSAPTPKPAAATSVPVPTANRAAA